MSRRARRGATSAPPVGPASETRVKVGAPVETASQRVADRRRSQRRDANDLLSILRKQLAELWWYGDRTLAGDSGVTADVARDEMAYIVCQIGMDLNQLEQEIGEMAVTDGEIVSALGALEP